MECTEVSTWLDAYIDGELEPERAAPLEAHVGGCARCATSIDERRSLRDTLAEGAEYRAAPAALRAAVLSRLNVADPPLRRAPAWAWMSVAACVALAGVTAWLAVHRPSVGAVEDLALREAVSSHIRSLMGSHLADIAVSDQHTVKPWFAGRLDFSPLVVDFASEGFPLAGGRLDYIGGRPVAAVIYNRRAHVINLFTCPDPSGGASPPRMTEDRGYHAVSWSDGSMRFCAVSDVNGDELATFVRMVRDER
jgi:anti-sigma factor (TIGR02949 family)